MAAPFTASGVQFSGAIPGGHGSCSFVVPVSSAFLAPHHSLTPGTWVTVYDADAHELWEGEILSVKPSFSGGAAQVTVDCGGLLTVAGKRADVSATWVHRGTEGWMALPGYPTLSNWGGDRRGFGSLESGLIDITIPEGASAALGSVQYVFFLDDLLSGEVISHVECTGVWDITDYAGSSANFHWYLYGAPTRAGLESGVGRELLYSAEHTSSAGTDISVTPTATDLKCLMVELNPVSPPPVGGTPAERYVRLDGMSVFSRSRTTKARIDEAMADLATGTGLATSSYTEAVGTALDDLHVGTGKAKVTTAAGLATLAGMYAQPVEWAFWDNRKFWVRPTPPTPDNDARVIVVGGGQPGLDSWDIVEVPETAPDYVGIIYGNHPEDGDVTMPEGWPRLLYRPSTPDSSADNRVQVVDYSSYILTDVTAGAIASNLCGASSGGGVPAGAIFDADPLRADSGIRPGNNVDPTTAYQDSADAALTGTLSGFAYTDVSGWDGSDPLSDPYCLVGDGTNDYVDFGDASALDFGTNAFSIRAWIRIHTLPTVGTTLHAASKLASNRGWSLGVTSAGKLRGYVGGASATPPPVSVSATGTVTTTTDGLYTVHKFTGSGSVIVSAGDAIEAEVLVVGGGGGGAGGISDSGGGGGGAGGYLTSTLTLTGTTAATVGGGGAGVAYGDHWGGTGGDSSFASLTAKGGGGGWCPGETGSTGPFGSGGGGCNSSAPYHALGTAGQGSDGGHGSVSAGKGAGGGGGGAAAAGTDAADNTHGGAGGGGTDNDIIQTGVNVGYAGGGGGGGQTAGGSATHGGGAGTGAAGTDYTGGGGGGKANGTGGNGGKGVVVVRYLTPDATAAANCRQQTGATTVTTSTWHHVVMTYAGSGGDIVLYLDGDAESLTASGATGAHDLSNAGSLYLLRNGTTYMDGGIGRVTAWNGVLDAGDVTDDEAATTEYEGHSLASGTVSISGTVKTRRGTLVPATHVRAGWWVQNLETGGDPLYISAHSVDLAAGRNALTIGRDWMEDEIGVRMAELLAMPKTAAAVSLPAPYTPGTSDYTTDGGQPGGTWETGDTGGTEPTEPTGPEQKGGGITEGGGCGNPGATHKLISGVWYAYVPVDSGALNPKWDWVECPGHIYTFINGKPEEPPTGKKA